MWPVSSMNEKSHLSVLKGTLTIDCWTYTQFSPAGSHKQNNGHLNIFECHRVLADHGEYILSWKRGITL